MHIRKSALLARFKPMATSMKNGVQSKVDVVSGNAQGTGPVGFAAFPAKSRRPCRAATAVADHFPRSSDAYYKYVLTLFGQGWGSALLSLHRR